MYVVPKKKKLNVTKIFRKEIERYPLVRFSMLTRGVLSLSLLRTARSGCQLRARPIFRMSSSGADHSTDVTEDIGDDVPWYMRLEESSTTQTLTRPLPELPPSSPESLTNIVKLMNDKLGIEDIKIFDKRDQDLEEVGMDISKNFIVIGTGKSDKHLQKATIELMNYIKHDLGNEKLPKVEGFTKSSSIMKKEKKLKRKLKKNTGYHFEDYGVPINSWIMVECDHNIDNMNIHFVTQQRREELNLELLWCNPEDRHLYKRVRKPLITDDIFSGLRRYHSVRSTPVYTTVLDLMKGSKRFYSSVEVKREIPENDQIILELTSASENGEHERASQLLQSANGSEKLKPYVMKSFVNYLDNLTKKEALELIPKDFEFKFQQSIPSILTKESLDLQLYFYKKLHQLWPKDYTFDLVENIFFEKLSLSYIDNTIDDLIEYLIMILESPRRSVAFLVKRINSALSVVEANDSFIKGWEHKLIPYMLISFSKFNYSQFITPNSILENIASIQKIGLSPKLLYYDQQIESLYNLLKYKQFNFLESNESQFILLMFLTIYGNAKDYTKFYKVLDEVYDSSGLQPDRRPWEFIISYIYKTADVSQYHHFVSTVYPQISYYSEFGDLFNKYLEKMKLEIEKDELSGLFGI